MKIVFYTAAANQRASRWEYPFPLAQGHLTLESMPDLRCECDRVHSADVNQCSINSQINTFIAK